MTARVRWHGGLTVTRPQAMATIEVSESKLTWWQRLRLALEAVVYLAAIVFMLKAGVLHVFFAMFGAMLVFGAFLGGRR